VTIHREGSHQLHLQQAAALMVMLLIMIMGSVAFLLSSLNSSAIQVERDKKTTIALAEAKEALIGDTVSSLSLATAGYLRLPDLGFGIGNVPAEGSSPPNFSGNDTDYSVIGKVPWKTLGISPSRDGQGECIWYVLSGRFKNDPTTNSAFISDTLGQIDVVDGNGNAIASNIVALLIAPGLPLDGQNRALSNPAYTQCGGNYDARNYLDPYKNSDAVSGNVNYFTGSTDNRIALNTNDKQFVMTLNNHYNDRFLFITADDIFRPIVRRADYSAQITQLMSDPYFHSVSIAGTKGTDSVICNNLNTPANQILCTNWLKLLLLKSTTGSCSRVLLFGGQKTAAQVRITTSDIGKPSNYLEGSNLTYFAAPSANSSNFTGTSAFNANNPSSDLLWCIP